MMASRRQALLAPGTTVRPSLPVPLCLSVSLCACFALYYGQTCAATIFLKTREKTLTNLSESSEDM
jgi:hypothetical protein